jgi:hypothetical protein
LKEHAMKTLPITQIHRRHLLTAKELNTALSAISIQGARLSPPVLAATGVEAPPKK